VTVRRSLGMKTTVATLAGNLVQARPIGFSTTWATNRILLGRSIVWFGTTHDADARAEVLDQSNAHLLWQRSGATCCRQAATRQMSPEIGVHDPVITELGQECSVTARFERVVGHGNLRATAQWTREYAALGPGVEDKTNTCAMNELRACATLKHFRVGRRAHALHLTARGASNRPWNGDPKANVALSLPIGWHWRARRTIITCTRPRWNSSTEARCLSARTAVACGLLPSRTTALSSRADLRVPRMEACAPAGRLTTHHIWPGPGWQPDVVPLRPADEVDSDAAILVDHGHLRRPPFVLMLDPQVPGV